MPGNPPKNAKFYIVVAVLLFLCQVSYFSIFKPSLVDVFVYPSGFATSIAQQSEFLYGSNAYPYVQSQGEVWSWIIHFVDSVVPLNEQDFVEIVIKNETIGCPSVHSLR